VGFAQYTDAVDIWSLGCIFAEMLTGTPLFPGRDVSHQLTLIFDVLGTPTKEDTDWILSGPVRAELHRLPFKGKVPWKNVFPKASADALDLVAKLLTFDPTKRINAREALRHPYLEAYHDRNSEPAGGPIPDEFFDFDRGKSDLNKAQLKSEDTSSYPFFEPLIDLSLRTDP
jgi:mitogen-activated protein kinase 1/3